MRLIRVLLSTCFNTDDYVGGLVYVLYRGNKKRRMMGRKCVVRSTVVYIYHQGEQPILFNLANTAANELISRRGKQY